MAKPQPKRSRGILTAKYTKDAKGRKTRKAERRRDFTRSRGERGEEAEEIFNSAGTSVKFAFLHLKRWLFPIKESE